MSPLEREAARQQALLRTLWRRASSDALAPWLADGAARVAAGVDVYRANAGASAERALAARYPTVRALIGEEGFAALARRVWHDHPPTAGDLARAGDALPAFLDADASLADWPYLGDVARVDDAVQTVERAADIDGQPTQLALLGEVEPTRLRLRCRDGLALVDSRWPVATLWRAHHDGQTRGVIDDALLAEAARAIDAGLGEVALIWRDGWRGRVHALAAADARFSRTVMAGHSLSDALDLAATDGNVDFQAWLLRALQQGWLRAIERIDAPADKETT